jgi:hypothetical protein
MSFLFDGIRSLPCLYARPREKMVMKGDSELSIRVQPPVVNDDPVTSPSPLTMTAMEDIRNADATATLHRVDRLKQIAVRKARILARLNFLAMFITIGTALYSGIYNVPVLSVISGICVLLTAALQWGPLSESYGKIAVRLTSIHARMLHDASLINVHYIRDIDDIEAEIESVRIVSYLWS